MKKNLKTLATAMHIAVSVVIIVAGIIVMSCIAATETLLGMSKGLLEDCADKCVHPYIKEKIEEASK